MGFRFFDQYSLLHFATGIVAYFFGLSFLQWLILHFIFEIVENTFTGIEAINRYFWFWPGGKPKPDSFINSIGDNIFAWLGWYAAYKLDQYGGDNGWYFKHIKY